jgi:hypothetical protein
VTGRQSPCQTAKLPAGNIASTSVNGTPNAPRNAAPDTALSPLAQSFSNGKRQRLESEERGAIELEQLLDIMDGPERPATIPGHPGNGTRKD